jgi:hypothetical protein
VQGGFLIGLAIGTAIGLPFGAIALALWWMREPF